MIRLSSITIKVHYHVLGENNIISSERIKSNGHFIDDMTEAKNIKNHFEKIDVQKMIFMFAWRCIFCFQTVELPEKKIFKFKKGKSKGFNWLSSKKFSDIGHKFM